MKKLIFFVLLMLLAVMLSGQAITGMYGLYYGESFADCKALLEAKHFIMIPDLEGDSVKKVFGLQHPTDVYMVQIFLRPGTNKLVSWSVHYVDTINDDQAAAIYQQCIDMHGEDFVTMFDEKLHTWKLGDEKNLIVAFDEKGHPKMLMYFDEDYPDLETCIKK
jgi:hypothetical protein